ncbi:hypothetical protein FB45DRAFT_236230 [Roridomyces roridus]|uniref:Uncharacterized protein n=1 Tax=Roridomyces roridus TaxID=1738132 RepID=A0AAD7FCM6_9AGAR|nr:hypothetical protein FB45DRAFT_236230 [Roridomyces roridus]
MPSLADAKAANAFFSPSYTPVAVFVGATSGVGQGMVEAFARYLTGRAHIIIIGRNEHAAADIIGRLPNPENEYTHEFIPCDVSVMANVRAVCKVIRDKVERVNFLVMTAAYSSMAHPAITSEGLDLHLAMRYYYRFVFIQELLPLVKKAQSLGEDAKVMSVLGAGRGSPKRPIDLDNLGNTVKPRTGTIGVSFRSMTMSSNYTDAMLAHFATRNPSIAFTHILPGAVRTTFRVDLDGFLTPLSWILNLLLPLFCVSKEVCAEHMLHALFAPDRDRGLFLCNNLGDPVSSIVFESEVELGENDETSVLNGVPMLGYGASDLGVRRIVEHSVAVTAA